MFKKIAKKLVLFLSAITLTVGAVGCTPAPDGNDANYDVWTTWNTMKVVREAELNDNYEKMEKGINVKMAKAESEMEAIATIGIILLMFIRCFSFVVLLKFKYSLFLNFKEHHLLY